MGANGVAHDLRIHIGMPSGPAALPGLRRFSRKSMRITSFFTKSESKVTAELNFKFYDICETTSRPYELVYELVT